MSPHIAIGKALEALEHPDSPPLSETLAEGLIVRHFTASNINAEEFHYYSAKLLKISQKRKEAA